MMNSFNMSNWRHKYITMSEIASEIPEVDSGYYDRNRATILASIEREGFSAEDAEQLFDLMKTDRLTQDQAIALWQDIEAEYRSQQGEEPEYDMPSGEPDEMMEEETPTIDAMSLYEKYFNAE